MLSWLRQIGDPLVRRWTGWPASLRSVFWMLGSALMFTAMSTLVKLLGENLNSFQIAFFRAFTGMVFVVPFMLRHAEGRKAFKTKHPVLHLTRGIAGSTGMMCGFYAFVHLPLATASAISFSRAIFLVPLAIIVANEVVGPRRIFAALVGFAGVLIILRPNSSMDPAALVAAASAVAVAVAVICVKLLSRTDPPTTLLFYSNLIGITATAIPAAMVWQALSLSDLLMLFLMGGFGVLAHTCFIRAYSIGEVSALAPVDYTRLIFSTIVGFAIFGNVPDLAVWIGAGLIVASTLYITLREAGLERGTKIVGLDPPFGASRDYSPPQSASAEKDTTASRAPQPPHDEEV